MPGRTSHPQPDARALVARARAAQREGSTVVAHTLLTQAHALAPRDPEILHALAMSTLTGGYRPEAIQRLRRAVAMRPRHAPWHRDLARALTLVARFDQALTPARRAVQLEPDSAEAHALLGEILHSLRRRDQAVAALRKALEIEPACPDAILLLARMHADAREDEQAEALLKRLTDAPSVHPDHHYQALHLLGTIQERRGAFDLAFETHHRANRAVATLPLARTQAQGGRIDRAPGYLPDHAPDIYRRWGAHRVEDGLPAPVFLVGFVRSGTTMTEQILNAHPRVESTDEQNFTEALYHRACAMVGATAEEDAGFLDRLDALTDAQLTELRQEYWSMVRAEIGPDAGSCVVVDKNPLEIVDAGLIARVFPRAPIVVLLRDPRDACLSALFQPFALNPSTVRMLDVESIGAFYAAVMGFWLAIRALIANPILEIRYEDLVTDFDTHARRLIEFIGLEWSEEVARFHEKAARRPVGSASYQAVTERINTRAVGRWAKYEAHLGPLLAHVRPFLDAFGYED